MGADPGDAAMKTAPLMLFSLNASAELGAAVAAVAVPLGWLGGMAVVASVTGAGDTPGIWIAVAAFLTTIAAMATAGAVLVACLRRNGVLRQLRGSTLD